MSAFPDRGENGLDELAAPAVFRDLEWQVARTRRAIESYKDREEERPGKGGALLDVAQDALDEAVLAYADAIRCARNG